MTTDSRSSNWALMTVYIIVLVVGFMISAFLVAFYWKVGDIRRVDPIAANYQVDPRSISQNSIFPLSAQVIESAKRDQRGIFPAPTVQTPVADFTPTSTATLDTISEPNPGEPTQTDEASVSTPTPGASPTRSRTPTRTQTTTLTPTTLGATVTQGVPTLTRTPRPTSVNPSNTPNNPAPTNTTRPQPTNTAITQPTTTLRPPTATQAPPPTATQSPPTATQAPRPTSPPPPTATRDSYPPPRPTDPPPTAYP